MPEGDLVGPEHPVVTRRRGLRYFFYTKHHRAGPSDDAQWSLSRGDEFAVFDGADFADVSNDKGDLYGMHKLSENKVAVIGTRGEQIAEFPVTPPGQPWHGYPCWPLARHQDGGRKARPSPEALTKMVDAGLLSRKHRSRLAGGKAI